MVWIVLIAFCIGIPIVVMLLSTYSRGVTLGLLSRPASIAFMFFHWLSLPDYNREWVDSYETRDGYHDVYETTFTGEPSRFEQLFDENTGVAFVVFNALFSLFIIYLFFFSRKTVKPVSLLDVEFDGIGMLCFSGLLLFNPFDPLIRYLPPYWALSIKTMYLLALGVWAACFKEVKQRFLFQEQQELERYSSLKFNRNKGEKKEIQSTGKNSTG